MLDKLPAEILLLIAEEHITDEATLNALARTSTWCYKNVDEVLYKHNATTNPFAIHWAACHNSPNTIIKALEAGADVDGLWSGLTPLMHAVSMQNLEVAKLLLKCKADPNVLNSRDQSALDYIDLASCEHPWFVSNRYSIRKRSQMKPAQLNMIELLLQHGAYPSIPDVCSETLLCRAIRSSDLKLIELLLRFRVHKDPGYQRGMSPLSLAMSVENLNKRIFDLQPARLLLEYGAPANETPGGYWGPMNITAKCGNTEGLQLLVEYGADVNTFDNEGNTPLQVAIMGGKIEFAHAILKAGALTEINYDDFPNRPRSTTSTPLHMAIEIRDIKLWRAILDHDPNPSVRETFANLEFEHYDEQKPRKLLAMKGLNAKKVKSFMLAEEAKHQKETAKNAGKLEEAKNLQESEPIKTLRQSFEASL